MIIGIDARAAAEVPGGKGRWIRELIRHLAGLDTDHAFHLYARTAWDEVALPERFSWRLVGGRGPAWHVHASRLAGRECDCYLAATSYLAPLLLGIPSVVIVYDLVVFKRGARGERWAQVVERLALRGAVNRAAAVAAISHRTRDDLVQRLPASAAKAVVIPGAAGAGFSPHGDDRSVLARHGLRRPYVLAIGARDRRKNLARLIEAFARLPSEVRGKYDLVLTGTPGRNGLATAASRVPDSRVRLVGFVSDHELAALYRRAELFCYPSLYEGFGLPLLEAMQCGTAVVASRAASLSEVGGDAARYVDPRDVGEIASALGELLNDAPARADLAARGLRRAADFDWEETARRTVALLERSSRRSGGA